MSVKLSVLVVASAFSMPVYSQGSSATSQSTPVVELIGINIQTSANPTNNQLDEEDLQIKNAGNPQRALRSMPGVFTNQLSNQPGIEISIRGLSGYGRINSMIDGVPQNFKNVAGHSSTGNNLLYVHPELLAGISVTRGVVSGAHGTGALAGAANMRTLSEEDVLTFGNTGGLTRIRFGNNGAHASGVAAVGHRFTGVGGDDGTLSIIAAGAYKNEGNYKTGDGSKLADNRSSDSSPKGGLVKMRFKPNDRHQFELGSVWYRNTFNNSNYEWDVDNTTVTADYAYTPNNPLISLKAQAYYNQTVLDYADHIGGTYAGRRIDNDTWGINITNDSVLSVLDPYDLLLSYGLAWDHNSYTPKKNRGGNHPGKIDKGSVYSNLQWTFGRTTLLAGLRYDHYRLNGYRPPYTAGVAGCPSGGSACGDNWETTSDGKLLPNIGFQFDLTEQWSLYGMYAHTFRPPSTHEVFYAGTPFGDGIGNGQVNNLALKGETSDGFDFAISYQNNNVFLDNDNLHFRLGYFNNRIKDYIFNDMGPVEGMTSPAIMWINSTNDVRMRGVELSAGYDAGVAYINLSYSHSKLTDQPIGFGTGFNGGNATLAPETIWTLDVGTRLFNERVNLGAQVRYLGKSKAAAGQFTGNSHWDDLPGYTLVDLYGNFKVNKHIDLFVNVENLSDRHYGYAGSQDYSSLAGRGRTVSAGIQARF